MSASKDALLDRLLRGGCLERVVSLVALYALPLYCFDGHLQHKVGWGVSHVASPPRPQVEATHSTDNVRCMLDAKVQASYRRPQRTSYFHDDVKGRGASYLATD
jgi:hypothetical protein